MNHMENLCLVPWTWLTVIASFFQSPQAAGSTNTKAISAIFDNYRGWRISQRSMARIMLTAWTDAPEDNPDEIGIDGTMKYLENLAVQLDEVACFAVLELLGAPTMGELQRDKFVAGWAGVGYVMALSPVSSQISASTFYLVPC